MDDLLGDEELESVSSSPSARRRTAVAWKASKERRKGCCSWRPRPRDGMQDRPDPDGLSSDLSSTKKTQWVGWTVNTTEWRPIKKWLPEACKADFLFAQETHLPKDALAAEESWMQGWRACIASALFRSPLHGEWVSTKQTVQQRKRGSHDCSSAAAWAGDAARRCWRQGHGALQRACACILPQRYCAMPGAESFSLHAHRQTPSTIGQWITPQALPIIIGGDFQVEPKQLEDSGLGARRRWLRGGAAARNGRAVALGHRFLRCLPRLRRRV